jgi:hypothetical protein
MVEHTMITAQDPRRRSRDLNKMQVGYPSVMHFEGHLAFEPEEICDLFAEFIQQAYTDNVGCLLIFAQNTSLAASVFSDRWKISYVTPKFKKGRPYYLQSEAF